MKSRNVLVGLLVLAGAIVSGCQFHDGKQVAWASSGSSAFAIYSKATSELRYHLNTNGEGAVRNLLLSGDYNSTLTEDFMTGPSTDTELFYTTLGATGPGDCLTAITFGWIILPASDPFCEVGETSAQN